MKEIAAGAFSLLSTERVHVQVFKPSDLAAGVSLLYIALSFLDSYAVKCSEDGETPIPSTFTKEDYIISGMKNSDYADKSSISGTEGPHYAALVVFQDATVNMPLSEPTVSNTGISNEHPILKTKLPCQEVPPHIKPIVIPALSRVAAS
ncbi:hypothetical protein DPMN_137982 [Dreissena polymorpha]|uniref:Uncharacterized protein n=1 Tax=Dreissena polymorpha TaxID=45954 RepID=A0A9D4G6G8_DREPO|nr:hypothetical protein DPMN_137982 [Dreissena polymorpha]